MQEETILVGNAQFMEDSNVDIASFTKRAKALVDAGHTVISGLLGRNLPGREGS
jgi:hypothetical protein